MLAQQQQPPSPPASTLPASPGPGSDPLLQTMAVARHAGADVATRLSALHAASADVRAALRLVPPAYMDALAAAADTAGLVAGGAWQGSRRQSAPGAALQQRLVELAADGADEAAAMLAELLGCACAADHLPLHQLLAVQGAAARTLTARLGDGGARLDAFAALLCTASDLAAARDAAAAAAAARGWMRDLALAAAGVAALPEAAEPAPVLSLLARLLAQHGAAAVEALAAYEGLRAMTRRIIALLSQPAPLGVAPALHVLTRLLLHAHPEPAPDDRQCRELARLADSLGCKLFDADHIARTLALIADLCLDCRAAVAAADAPPGASDAPVAHDLRVLREVAGTVDALARTGRAEVRALFFQSAALAPALGHLVAMARLDRRYLAPLLAMVNAIVESAGGGLRAQPAAASLFESRDYGQADSLRDGSAPAPSIVDELFDIVLSGIEDAADTVPRFALPPAEWLDAGLLDVVPGAAKAARRAEPARPPWPRVSSEERGAGWFVSCGAEHRRQIHLFVRLALATPPDEPPAAQAVCWRQELADAAAQVLGAFLVPAGLDSPNARIGDPFGAARVAADTDDPAAYLRALQARHAAAAALPSVLGTYYWAVRPVVALLADVAPLESRRAGSGSAAGGELAEIMRWAESVCAGLASGPAALLGEALFDDVCHIIAAPGAGQLAESTAVSPGPALVAAQDSAVTPLELESSAASSPDPACDIAVSDLRAACAGANGALEPAAATPGQLAQAAVLRHWARTCEAELAAMLVACGATAAQGGAGLAQSEAVRGLARRAQLLVLAQPSGGQQGQSPLLDKLSLALAAGQRHRALQQPLAGRLAEQRAKLAAADRESGGLRRSLQQALESHAAQRDQAAEQAQALQRAEADAARWEAECGRERARLAQSEAAGAEAREQLVRLADRHEALQAAVDAKQAAWDSRQLSLTESIRGLEVALAEAMARVRELDAQAAADHAAAELLRAQADQMRATLADYAKVSDALHDLSRRPH